MKIEVKVGTFSETCTSENDLLKNAMIKPEIHTIMQYAEQRNLITYIVSGAKYGNQTASKDDTLKTKIGMIPKASLVGSAGYRYRVMGRIQRPSNIVAQVGTSTEGGYFQLAMEDTMLYSGLMVTFTRTNQTARVESSPRGTVGNQVYTFKTDNGVKFDWDTWVEPMSVKKLFGGHTSYGEKSIRGYSRAFYPDSFINHTTIQRKSCARTGSADGILWITPEGQKPGWYPEQVAQMNTQMGLEDEHAKMWGRSNMVNTDGTWKEVSDEIDPDTGYPITRGSGIWEQIEGVNDSYTSGLNGRATYEDFREMMKTLKRHAKGLKGNHWIAVCGDSGMTNAYDVLEEKSRGSYNLTVNKNSDGTIGGPEVEVGYDFVSLNVDGNKVTFVEHAMMTDDERWHDEAIDGTKVMSGSYVFLCMNEFENSDMRNIEIKGRGAYGVNRSHIVATIAGMTGYYAALGIKPMTSVDADEYHYLKEDGIFIYNTKCCGILHRSKS